MTDLVDKVAAALEQASQTAGVPFAAGPLVAGVSGGPDSMALLHALSQLMPVEQLIVAHLDHGLRPGSAADGAFVASVAAGHSFHAERVDVGQLARDGGLSIEEAGRMARYDFLARVAAEGGAPAVAVGHNADDQAETVLMNIVRGSGLRGLRGMQTAAPLPNDPALWLLRPLLHVSRAEIEAYCAAHELHPNTDESNTDPAFLRNRVRHELLPLLESYNPQIHQRLRELAEVVTGDEALLSELTDRAWADVVTEEAPDVVTLRREAWLALPLALRRRVLRRAVASLRPTLRDTGYRTLDAARLIAEVEQTGAQAALPGGLTLLVSYDQLIISTVVADLTSEFPQVTSAVAMPLDVPGLLPLANGWYLESTSIDRVKIDVVRRESDPWTVFVAADAAEGLHVRPRQPGERMRPLGLGGESKLKEIMINRKIPAHLRAGWPVVANERHPIWLPGHVLDERGRVVADGAAAVRLRCFRPGATAEPVDDPALQRYTS